MQADDDPVIQPVRYRPTTAAPTRRRRITPIQGVLLALGTLAAAVLVFLFTARSVEFQFIPSASRVSVSGGPALAFGEIHLLLQQRYTLLAEAEGYYPLEMPLDIGPERNQSFPFEFVPLPGLVTVVTEPEGASLTVDGRPLGETPLEDIAIEAGARRFRFTHPRYQSLDMAVAVEGRNRPQTVDATLLPNWGDIAFSTEPPGARIFVDDADTGTLTNGIVQILDGEHDIRLTLPGHRSHRQRILVTAQEERTLPTVRLQRADGTLVVRTRPGRAGVTVDGRYQGEAPVSIALQSGRNYEVQAFKGGFAPRSARVRLNSGEERILNLDLEELTGLLVVQADPAGAPPFHRRATGRYGEPDTGAAGAAPPVGNPAGRLRGYSREIQPRSGLTQELKVKLLTLEEARLAALQPEIVTAQGQRLKLFEPGPITMGAPPGTGAARQRGAARSPAVAPFLPRCPRSDQCTVQGVRQRPRQRFLRRPAPRQGKPARGRGELARRGAVLQLALRTGQPAAVLRGGIRQGDRFQPAVDGISAPRGRRMGLGRPPSAGQAELLRFPWGPALPPPARHGNYADRAASNLVGRIISRLQRQLRRRIARRHLPPHVKGLYDLGGNVRNGPTTSTSTRRNPQTGPLGPAEGEYHVIRGSSWMHGTTTDLRLSFRDYGIDGRRDVGFRIARFAE